MAKRSKAEKSDVAADKSAGKSADKADDKKLSPATISRILTTAKPGEFHRQSIRLASYNPRQISESAFRRLCDSIRKFGLVQRPLINTRTGNTVVGGHQRIKAADKVFGTTDYSLPVDLIDVDETTERALNVALNNPELQGQYDIDLLGEVVASIKESGGNVRDTGFSLTDMQMLFDDDFIAAMFSDERGNGPAAAVASQIEAETPHVELLAEIRSASTGSASTGAGDGDGGDGASGGTTGDVQSQSQSPAGQHPAGQPNPPAGLNEQQLVREDLAAKRERFKAATLDPHADHADVTVTLVFERPDMVPRFLKDIQMDTGERFVDGVEVARVIGLEGW